MRRGPPRPQPGEWGGPGGSGAGGRTLHLQQQELMQRLRSCCHFLVGTFVVDGRPYAPQFFVYQIYRIPTVRRFNEIET